MIGSKLIAPVCFAAALFIAAGLTGCTKKSGEVIVLEKEHIAAAEPTPSATPKLSATREGATPVEAVTTPDESRAREHAERELAADEIVVDTYVMKKEVRGTSKDPRAYVEEQWLLKVELVEGGRRFTVRTDRVHYDKAQVGDRLKVSYRQGRWTRTVWSARIED